MHYAICMVGQDKDPINSGTTASWFFYYKWRPGEDDEVFFPIPEDAVPAIQANDVVWFVLDGKVVGNATLLRVELDEMNDRKELWYNCLSCVPMRASCALAVPVDVAPLDEDTVTMLQLFMKEAGDAD